MKTTKLIWFGVLAGLFLIGSVMRSPHSQASGATYSTPVSVMNTTSDPGSVLDANLATRVPYQSIANTSDCPATNECTYSFSPVPLGYRLVVEYVGGSLVLPTASNPTGPVGTLSYTPAFGGNAKWSATVMGSIGPGNNGSSYGVFGQQVRAYIDPGTPTLFVFVGNGSASGTMQLIGYLQNCSVSPCPAAQN
ncbi:MAG TPA: hypothetical protein VKB88_12315 [Bryobacteraceae bacterium]|nr:hypothetical protein [Bryobacteraceae bacterium]